MTYVPATKSNDKQSQISNDVCDEETFEWQQNVEKYFFLLILLQSALN